VVDNDLRTLRQKEDTLEMRRANWPTDIYAIQYSM